MAVSGRKNQNGAVCCGSTISVHGFIDSVGLGKNSFSAFGCYENLGMIVAMHLVFDPIAPLSVDALDSRWEDRAKDSSPCAGWPGTSAARERTA